LRKNGRHKGKKKGVLYCGIDPDEPTGVVVGFSVCHPTDRFDYVNGQRTEGFGLEVAKNRAERWKFKVNYFVQMSFHEDQLVDDNFSAFKFLNPDNETVVEIPPSVMVRLKPFIERCKKYYKDKIFPEWVDKVHEGNPYPITDLEKEPIEYVCINMNEMDLDTL
jgi:hypothetical protein